MQLPGPRLRVSIARVPSHHIARPNLAKHVAMSHPSGTDPALAALSSQLPTINPAGSADFDDDEVLQQRGPSLNRRESIPASFRSEYTSATGGNSVYADPEGSFAGSQATIQRSVTDDSFADANEGLASLQTSQQDLTFPGPPKAAAATAADRPTATSASPDQASALATPVATPSGTFSSNPSTIRATVLPPAPSPTGSGEKATTTTSNSLDEKRASGPARSVEKKGKKGKKGGDETPKDEEIVVDELDQVKDERWRQVLNDQM